MTHELATGDATSRTLELRVRPQQHDGRRPLAVFERRGGMHYLVQSIRAVRFDQVRDRETFLYPPDGWQRMPGAALEPQPSGDGQSVAAGARVAQRLLRSSSKCPSRRTCRR